MRGKQLNAYSFRTALLAYAALILALTFPYWLQGEVVAPDRQATEVAAPVPNTNVHLENKKFGDYAKGFIPEIVAQRDHKRSGWLALWTDRNELGRPLDQTSGFGPAYAPSWLLAKVTDSPQRFITFLALGTCLLAGLFVLLLCRELQLSPVAGLLAAGSLAASPEFMYWLTFPMFLAAWCWSAAALYGLIRLFRERDLRGWSVLAFSVYSLLMTAYQQDVVLHAYILTAYGAYLGYRHWRSNSWKTTVRYLALVASAVVVGGMLTLPVYLDLARTASESARVAPDISFFTAVLPNLDSPIAVARFLALITFPEIFGNPMSPSYPFTYNGLSLTPLVIFLALAGLLLRWRNTWGWWLAIVALCAVDFIRPLYVFGVNYLGLNLSRSDPMGSIMLPLTIVTAYGADALFQRSGASRHPRAVMIAAALTVIGSLLVLAFGLAQGLVIRWGVLAMTLAVAGLLAAQSDRARPLLLIAALVLVGAYISFPLMLRQDASQIVTTSPLVAKVRDNLPPDSRYAVASPGLAVLPPNVNATFDLSSIHSYNSLSSRRYHTLIKDLGGEVRVYGRRNESISPDYGSAAFWMSNISLMLAPKKLQHDNLDFLGQTGEIYLHRVISRMGCCLQINQSADSMTLDGVQVGDPRRLVAHQPIKTVDQGDLLEFDVRGDEPSILVLSQKFHRDWNAQVRTSSGWSRVKTAPVNGVFQGVLLPAGAQKLQLQFEPFVRFAWVAHVFWLLVLIVLASQGMHRRFSPSFATKRVSTR